jgi:8-oxo-dGTP diphosphatase
MTASPTVAVGGVTRWRDALLLVRRANAPEAGRWTIPGGRVEAGESLADAVVREVHEETGVLVRCDHFLGWAERISDEFHYVVLDFVAPVVGGRPVALRAGSDASDAAWVPLPEVGGVPLVTGLGAFLEDHGVTEPRRPSEMESASSSGSGRTTGPGRRGDGESQEAGQFGNLAGGPSGRGEQLVIGPLGQGGGPDRSSDRRGEGGIEQRQPLD